MLQKHADIRGFKTQIYSNSTKGNIIGNCASDLIAVRFSLQADPFFLRENHRTAIAEINPFINFEG